MDYINVLEYIKNYIHNKLFKFMLFLMVEFFLFHNHLLLLIYFIETNSIQTNFSEDALFTGKILNSYLFN